MTPIQTMIAKLPILEGESNTVTMMSYGFDPYLSKWSPFHGAVYAITESISKIVASGGNYKKIRLTFQEYFKRLGEDKTRWGQPVAAPAWCLSGTDRIWPCVYCGKRQYVRYV